MYLRIHVYINIYRERERERERETERHTDTVHMSAYILVKNGNLFLYVDGCLKFFAVLYNLKCLCVYSTISCGSPELRSAAQHRTTSALISQ